MLWQTQEVLKDRDIKLAEAQKTQVDLLRKQRELDDAKRELDLAVEKKVQESLTTVRDKATFHKFLLRRQIIRDRHGLPERHHRAARTILLARQSTQNVFDLLDWRLRFAGVQR